MGHMNISIIQAAPEHAKDIARICSTGWRQTVQGKYSEAYQTQNVQYWYNHKRVLEDMDKGIYTYVAIAGQIIAGTIGGVVTNQGVSDIYVYYVDDEHRYKGIGTKLLQALTKNHLERGATDQCASVEEGNKLGIPFYEARGFRRKSQSKRYWRPITNDHFYK